MTKQLRDRLNQALILTNALAKEHEQCTSDKVYIELATAFACVGRAKSLLLAREAVDRDFAELTELIEKER